MNVALIVIGVVVALVVGAFLALVSYDRHCGRLEAKEEARVRRSGRPAMSVLVMANSRLLSGEVQSAPALVAVDLGSEPSEHAEALRTLAARTYELYVLPDFKVGSLGRAEQSLALHAKDHAYRANRRFRVPNELSAGREIYLLDAWLFADRIRRNTGTVRLIPCMVTGRSEGEVMQLPWTDPGARRLFERYEGSRRSAPPQGRVLSKSEPSDRRAVPGGERKKDRVSKPGRGKFAVLLASYNQLDPEDFAPILAEALGILPYDAVALTRDARGILGDLGITEEAAERLVEGLGEAGIEAFAFPHERVLRIGKPVQVRNLEFQEGAFSAYLGYTAKPQICSYDALVLASGGWIVETRKKPTPHRKSQSRTGFGVMKFMGGMAFGAVGYAAVSLAQGVKEEGEKVRNKSLGRGRQASTEVGVADLFVREDDGSFLHLRLRNRDLYYPKILGEEAVTDFQVNFSQVLCRILNGAPKAAFSKGLKHMISDEAGVDPAEAEFGSEKEFTAFTRWLLQITEVADLLPKEAQAEGLEEAPYSLAEDEPIA